MLSKNLAGKSLPELQKALMGGDPSIEPYQALAAIEKMVKAEKAKTAQMAQQQRPQGMVAQRTLAEAAALRNPYMAAGLGAAPVAPPVTTPMGEQAPQEAPVGMAGGGMVAFAKGGLNAYETDFEPMTEEEQTASFLRRKAALGEKNAELLAPLEKYQLKYEQEAEKADKNAVSDTLIAAGLGMMSGDSQYAAQNIGKGGLKGLEAYQNAQRAKATAQEKLLQSQTDMAKSRIALEKGDETTAAALQNQARQEAQAAAQFKLQGQYYAGSNAASLAAANARSGAAGLTDYQYGKLQDAATDNVNKMLEKSPMTLINAKKEAKAAGIAFNEQAFRNDLVRQEAEKLLRGRAGGATIATNTPGAGAAGGNKVIDFNKI